MIILQNKSIDTWNTMMQNMNLQSVPLCQVFAIAYSYSYSPLLIVMCWNKSACLDNFSVTILHLYIGSTDGCHYYFSSIVFGYCLLVVLQCQGCPWRPCRNQVFGLLDAAWYASCCHQEKTKKRSAFYTSVDSCPIKK